MVLLLVVVPLAMPIAMADIVNGPSLELAEKRLQIALQSFRKELGILDKLEQENGGDPFWLESFDKAQVAWWAFVRADCEFSGALKSGGTGYVDDACVVAHIDARIAKLKE